VIEKIQKLDALTLAVIEEHLLIEETMDDVLDRRPSPKIRGARRASLGARGQMFASHRSAIGSHMLSTRDAGVKTKRRKATRSFSIGI
jgi:hypothetical protein